MENIEKKEKPEDNKKEDAFKKKTISTNNNNKWTELKHYNNDCIKYTPNSLFQSTFKGKTNQVY